MLLGLAGVTGIGKSYYKDKIVEKLNFDKIKIITTRPIRQGEKNNEDKIFVTPEELNELRNSKKIAYEFNMLGNTYAYTYEAMSAKKNTVFEVHYSTIADLKAVCPNLCTIYILPRDVNIAKEKTKQRNLKPEVEKSRLLEIDEHYNRIMNDNNLRSMFDYIVYNDYNKQSENEIINLVRTLLK